MLITQQYPIYFIPGLGFNGQIFRYLMPIDFLGFQLDYTHLANQSINTTVNYLADKMLNGSIIIAWSLGELFAIKIAVLYPEKIKKLILIASQPFFLKDRLWQGICERDIAYFRKYAEGKVESFLKYYLSLVNYPNYSHYFKSLLKNNMLIMARDSLQNFLAIMSSLDLRTEYQTINKPILHIVGKMDAIINQQQCCFAKLNKNVHIEMINTAGHAGFITHKKSYLRIIMDFI